MIILDTNVVSEVLRETPSENVIQWLSMQEPLEVYLTTVTEAELRNGVEGLPAGKRRDLLQTAVDRLLEESFMSRILPFGRSAARLYPKIVNARRMRGLPIGQFDAMIAAIALHHQATIATRDVSGFADCGVTVVNPWAE